MIWDAADTPRCSSCYTIFAISHNHSRQRNTFTLKLHSSRNFIKFFFLWGVGGVPIFSFLFSFEYLVKRNIFNVKNSFHDAPPKRHLTYTNTPSLTVRFWQLPGALTLVLRQKRRRKAAVALECLSKQHLFRINDTDFRKFLHSSMNTFQPREKI